MKTKIKNFFAILMVLFISVTIVIAGSNTSVMAEVYGAEGSGPSGGGKSCVTGSGLCTSYGAEWRYYTTDSDDVYIPGKGKSYAHATHIVGCAKAGGYYRYAMVDQETKEQVGVTSIGGTYKSEYFGGRMKYGPTENALPWADVQKVYLELQEQYPNIFSLGWTSSSQLAWFCAGMEEPPTPPETCEDGWQPQSYKDSEEYKGGVTTIDEKIKNDDERFGGVGYGGWNDDTIYAKPTDKIVWLTCYYPGVQVTYSAKVGSINIDDDGKTEVTYYPDYDDKPLPDNACEKDIRKVESKELHEKYNAVKVTEPWENKFYMKGHAGEKTVKGDLGDATVLREDIDKVIAVTEVGKTFTETSVTDKPVESKINKWDKETDWLGCYCKGDATSWDPVPDPNNGGLPMIGPDGNQVKGPANKWNFDKLCSCCKSKEASHSIEKNVSSVDENKDYTGHTNKYEAVIYDATVTTGPKDDSVSVKVPFNFIISTEVKSPTTQVLSGHASQFDFQGVDVTVHTRSNGTTQDTYATIVWNAEVRLYAYVISADDMAWNDDDAISGASNAIGGAVVDTGDICETLGGAAKQCVMLESKSGVTLNGNGELEGHTDPDVITGRTYNAFDASAGDYMCLASAVSPSESMGDRDMIGSGPDYMWVYSEPKCAVIAKQPTFQVWGSSLYSVEDVTSLYNSKVNIYKNYHGNNEDTVKALRKGGTLIHFYPWVEESLIIKDGITRTVSSGAAGGLNSDNDVDDVGVGTTDDFCENASALSFANYGNEINDPCKFSSIVGKSKISSGIGDRAKLIEYWVGNSVEDEDNGKVVAELAEANVAAGSKLNLAYPDAKNVRGESVWRQIASATGSKIRYAYSEGNINIFSIGSDGKTAAPVPKGTTYLIQSDETVTITGDIKYDNDEYGMFAQIPKLVIYAKNVNIECDVNEVDAIIVTGRGGGKGEVKTCSNGGDNINSEIRSRRLKIFGMVITDNINLGRTYGSAANGYNCGPNKNGSCGDVEGNIPADGAAAEVFDYDSSILMWSEFMAGSNESDTLQTVYQHEIAPRY